MPNIIFVTGGVVSSLGKGIASAAIGAILHDKGYKVTIKKLDPYLNVDPGTMNPLEHGEVFVTVDGGETDLDLGHYERFTCNKAKKSNNITAGKIYQELLQKERRGDYLGSTVQVIPHVTDLIKSFILNEAGQYDFVICEIGGTVGDIESQPFIEAIRQISRLNHDIQTIFIHMTLIPYIESSNEIKTKPTQHSVKELMSLGIEPDVLLCRSGRALTEHEKKKISLFCNVSEECVIDAPDVKNVYELPIIYANNGLGIEVLKKFGIQSDIKFNKYLTSWQAFINDMNVHNDRCTVVIAGKYVKSQDAYKSLVESITHAAVKLKIKANIEWVDVRQLDNANQADIQRTLSKADCVIVPGGYGKIGSEGKIKVIKHCRENNIPFLGICLGMQLAVVEFARNVMGITNATSLEFATTGKKEEYVITLITSWTNDNGKIELRTNDSALGGTMRLGSYTSTVLPNTLAYEVYNNTLIQERHRHRYEVNVDYVTKIEKYGGIFSSYSEEENLPEMFELGKNYNPDGNNSSGVAGHPKKHPFFIACQFHPEFESLFNKPHPLFVNLLYHAINYKNGKR